MNEERQYYTITEAAEKLDYSRSWIVTEIENGNLTQVWEGIWLIPASEVDNYVRRPRGARAKARDAQEVVSDD